ncbi:MAG: c-type cytochrome biogenesis protein CcmI [Lautropia sp.]|nr:c-type cytochrome biogenesis protein CcmI [Lautropia sp.]
MTSPSLFLGLLVLAATIIGLFVCWPLLRKQANSLPVSTTSADQLNRDIVRDRRQQLDEELAALPPDAPGREDLIREFTTSALADLTPAEAGTLPVAPPRRRLLLAITFVTLLVAMPLAFYRVTGMPDAVVPGFEEKAATPDIQRMLAQLEERLATEPGLVEGWLMLGRSRLALGEQDRAIAALERARELDSPDPAISAQIRTDLADALGQKAHASLKGRPWELIQEALQRQPDHPKALALAGAYQLSQNHPELALGYWKALLKQLKPGTPQYEQVNQYMANVRAQAASSPDSPAAARGPQDQP